jgi:hypothetical protein
LVVVPFERRNSYQGMPSGVPQAHDATHRFSGYRGDRRKPAAEAVSCLAGVGGIAEAKP